LAIVVFVIVVVVVCANNKDNNLGLLFFHLLYWPGKSVGAVLGPHSHLLYFLLPIPLSHSLSCTHPLSFTFSPSLLLLMVIYALDL